MDEFKPEDELKPDPSDRRSGRARRADERDNEPQINVDDVELDADEPRPARSRRTRDEEEYENDDDLQVEAEERRPARTRKKSAKQKVPVSRQHLMMGIGILVLLLLIIGIGSALKAPSSSTETAEQKSGAEKNIDLSGSNGNAADQANGAQPQPGNTSAANQTENAGNPQEVTLPAISSTPTDAQTQPAPQGQQRVEVPGDLNNALTQQSGQIDNAVNSSTLPTAPATVAAVAGSNGATTAPRQVAKSEPAKQTAPRQERKTAVIAPAPAKQQPVAKVTEPKPVTTAKRSEPVTAPTATAPVKAPVAVVAPKATATETAAAPKATAAAPVTAATGAVAGDAGAIKGAPGSHYTLQLSSSSNSANLNAWAKKENLQHYMVYQTVRNGQPWYVLVSGIYANKDEAKRAVATLPADVQAKNPWAKPIHQVQSDLK
jgi:DamX protein